MPLDLDAERAQLLDQSPHFGAPSADLFADLGAAHHYHRMIHEHTHDSSQARICFLRSLASSCAAGAGWRFFRDGGDYIQLRVVRRRKACRGGGPKNMPAKV